MTSVGIKPTTSGLEQETVDSNPEVVGSIPTKVT